MKNLTFAYTHSEINAHFNKSSKDFIVREVPLYDFSGDGEHLILHIQKKGISTNELLKHISGILGIKTKEIGYAGLKDKQGLTSQYISIEKKYENKINSLQTENIKILDTFLHKNKIKLGHLKGNKFFIRLKKVDKINALKLENVFKNISQNGFLNYFGYQRFGKFQNNYEEGFKILNNEKKIKDKKLKDFLISAYQSKLFNDYASYRMKLSHLASNFNAKEFSKIYDINLDLAKKITSQKSIFKLIPGEVMAHYPQNRLFTSNDLNELYDRFTSQSISPTGMLIGKCMQNLDFAKQIEEEIFKSSYEICKNLTGDRRFLWCFLRDTSCKYNEEKAHFLLEFELPKGSYATIILGELLHKTIEIS